MRRIRIAALAAFAVVAAAACRAHSDGPGRGADGADGAEAIQAWETGRYNLILMDCQMPEIDGYRATQEIRAPGDVSVTTAGVTA